jgi:tetratricopeptide (TPR) repeat protein
LAEFDAALQANPRQTRIALGQAVDHATRAELPQLLCLCGSCYRVETDLDHADVVLGHAREMTRKVDLPAIEADSLIRMAYVDLERNRLHRAMGKAHEAIAISARIDDREGEGIGFLTTGFFRYYSKEYEASLKDFEAALKRSTIPRQRFSIHQCSALCLIELDRETEARAAIQHARALSSKVETWLRGKLSWVEAGLAGGTERLAHLTAARNALSPRRPADCALVTIELIEEALALARYDLAEQEALRLCTLTEKTGSPRVERAIFKLIHRRTRLTPELVATIRKTVEEAQARRLSRLIRSNH